MPTYSGIGGVSFTIPNVEPTAPKFYKFTNRSPVFAYSDGKTIISQQLGDGSLNVFSWCVQLEVWREQLTYKNDIEAVKAVTLQPYKRWDSWPLDLVRREEDPFIRLFPMLPVGWECTNRADVALIGDAAHVMAPFAGEGVNLGLQDALMLSRAIVNASTSLDTTSMLPAGVK
ncbi:hypothetical protein N7457_008730 [Penicillium paradoxum]|uniref:uncharacterized protein n=1 Tax=Penicillium paradoxum TaxID=176176 RepID=UPI0025494EF8|nr:uncharacterized protein N7457_008730 [Penicillium paradoxum]KAJ5773834.1 hypothetical protein N7457_008730 [Penicillium paradoxum]